MHRRSQRSNVKILTLGRIHSLFAQAERVFSSHPSLSHRYVQLSRRLAMKARIPLPRALKRRFCKHCYRYLQPGANCRVRVRNRFVVYFCFSCKRFMKFGISKLLKKAK